MLKLLSLFLLLLTVAEMTFAQGFFTPFWILSMMITAALSLFISCIQTSKSALSKEEEHLLWQMKLAEVENRASQTIDTLHQQMHKITKQAGLSEERCVAYQKLSEIHQRETEHLRKELHHMSEELITQERKICMLSLQKLEPDLFGLTKEALSSQIHCSCDPRHLYDKITRAEEARDVMRKELHILKQLLKSKEPKKL
ncbi:MAG: hypothetical protein QRY71_00945 [Candidatus Rhabdochlamydia sp.]